MTFRNRSLAARAKGARQGPGCLVAFFAIFLLAGLGIGVPLAYIPLRGFYEARSWTAVPCTIESSEVVTHSGDDSDTYSVAVRYVYKVDGVPYHGDRYRFTVGSSSGRASKEKVVAALPPGAGTACWVDPADPARSVLDRNLGWEALLILVPLIFVAIGGGGVVWALREVFRQRRATAAGGAALAAVAGTYPAAQTFHGSPGSGGFGANPAAAPTRAADLAGGTWPEWLPRPPGDGGPFAGPVRCAPQAGPVGRLVGIGCAALFWNGIVGVFVWQAVKSHQEGNLDGCLVAFLVPFVLVGLALLVGVPYQILALFNPRPEVTLGRASVAVGGTLGFSWAFRGATGRITRLRISAVGEEVAIYRRGTDTHTDRSTFAELQLIDVQGPMSLGTGHGSLAIPAGSMHSFAAAHNRIEWKLKLHGEIARWPDVVEEYELLVLPHGMEGGNAG